MLGFRISLAAPERVSGFLALNAVHPWPLYRRLLPQAWRNWYTALLEYPGVGRRGLAHWQAPGRVAFSRAACGSSASRCGVSSQPPSGRFSSR